MPFAEGTLHRALETGQFVPYYQPLVDLRTGHIHGFEMLARWENPAQGLLPPSVFIPLIERYRLMNNLSANLLIQAFATARNLPADFGLSVNLSPSQLHDRTLPDLIQIMADEAEFDLKRLTVELTETALVDDLDLAQKVAGDFKRLGIRLALDDFGTGYSSLLHLQTLPFDEIKVDHGFVRSMAQSRQSRKITAAVISLGLSLGLRTVAEGIEEQSQANLLAWQGCNLGQGYLYGRAVPAADLPAILERRRLAVGLTAEVPASLADPFLALDAQPTERLSQLRAIYDSAPVGLTFINSELRYVNLNQQLAQINGRSVEAHLGRKVSEMVEPQAYAQLEPYLKRALKGESLPGIEIRRYTPTGEIARILSSSYQPVKDEAGEILGICISIFDITAQKQKEQALRESEDHYRHTVELNPQIPWLMDAEGNNISVSSRWQTVTGLTKEQSRNHGWMDAVHAEDLPRVKAGLETSLKTGAPIDMEYRVLSEAGWVWMRSRGAARRDAAGNVMRWYGSVESIDEQKRAADEMRRNEARLRAIFDAAPVGIVLVESATRRVLNANPCAEERIGFRWSPDMIWSNEGWVAFDSSGQRIDGEQMPLTRAIRRGEVTHGQRVRLLKPDGSECWLSLTAAPVRDENGEMYGALLVVQELESGRFEGERMLELARELALVASHKRIPVHRVA